MATASDRLLVAVAIPVRCLYQLPLNSVDRLSQIHVEIVRGHACSGVTMNWNMIEGNWRLYRHELQGNWSRLTGADLDLIGGKRQQLSERLQDYYGISGSEAERQIARFQSKVTNVPRYYTDRNFNAVGHPRRV